MWAEALAWLQATRIPDVVLVYSLAVVGTYLVLGALAYVAVFRQHRDWSLSDRLGLFDSDLAPPISILVPAHNEEPTIVESVRSLMQLRYPSFEIIVVNDGSKDDTLEALVREFRLRPSSRTLRARVPRERVRGVYASPDYPALTVLDVVNGGKARALNIALAYGRHPLFCAIDADSVLERDTLLHLALPFFHDPATLVVGGVVRPANGCQIERGRVLAARMPAGHLARFQVVEYLRGMLAGRLGWSLIDSLYIVSGALGLFSREAVLSAGGYRTDTLGEDMELVMRLQRWAGRHGRRRAVRSVGSAVAWTEVPVSLAALGRQRARWHQGLAESLWANRALVSREHFSFHHGLAYLTQVMIELFGPVVEAGGYLLVLALILTGRWDTFFVSCYAAIFVMGGTITSLVGIGIETLACPRYTRQRDFALLAGYALVENLGYRQLTSFWRLQGFWNALRRRHRWGGSTRRGHGGSTGAADLENADVERAA